MVQIIAEILFPVLESNQMYQIHFISSGTLDLYTIAQSFYIMYLNL